MRNTYILICRELHAHATQVPRVQVLPDSELADAALQDTELCWIDMATMRAVKCWGSGHCGAETGSSQSESWKGQVHEQNGFLIRV